MPILVRNNPVNYGLCSQTVTVYHQDKATKEITKTIHNRAFLEFRKNQNVDKTGSSEVNSFLLVLPCNEQTVFVGDKVFRGVGPDVTNWAQFIPVNVPDLVVVKSVDPKFWDGKLVHIEAGG